MAPWRSPAYKGTLKYETVFELTGYDANII